MHFRRLEWQGPYIARLVVRVTCSVSAPRECLCGLWLPSYRTSPASFVRHLKPYFRPVRMAET